MWLIRFLTPLFRKKWGVNTTLVLLALTLFSLKPYFTSPLPPSPQNPILIYSNQTYHNLQQTVYEPIENAKKRIVLSTFGETESELLSLLTKKQSNGVDVLLHYDAKSFPLFGERKFSFKTLGHRAQGLMHQKVLAIDDSFVYLGSTNFTKASYKTHDNLLIGVYSPELTAQIAEQLHHPDYPYLIESSIEGARLRFWSLPGLKDSALHALIDAINKAQTTIDCRIFTFTHLKICDALLCAKRRGVEVEVTIDKKSFRGSSKKIAGYLKKVGVQIYINNHGGMMQHNMCWIDKKVFIFGSANWTKAAFEKNRDYLVLMDQMNPSLEEQISKLFEASKRFNKPY